MSNQGDEETESKLSTLEDEDNPHASAAGPFMCRLFERQLYTDVTFSSCGDKASISAHRAVLAAKSDFFRKLLFGDQKNEAVGMEMQVQISNVPFSVFTNVVKYFYTDDIEFTDDYTILEIYAAAESFQIQHLIDRCKIYIESMELTEDNVCSTFQVCNNKHVEGLKDRCISYIEKNTYQVMSSTDFDKCSLSTVRQICQLQCLNLRSEADLLEAVLRWVNVQKKHTRKELTRSLLKCIRFLSLTPKEFSEVMQKYTDLLTFEEGLKILMYLNNPTPESLKTLPKWCDTNQRSFKVDQKEIRKDLLQQCSEEGRIKVLLKPSNVQQNLTELTCALLMMCRKGMHQIKSIKFSFEDIKNDGNFLADLVIKMYVRPKGPSFLKSYSVNSSESSFTFPLSVTVTKGQIVKIEVTAKIGHSCKFFQFHRWQNDPKRDFYCTFNTFVNIPKLAKLNFISEIEYEPLAPRLNATQDTA